VQYQVKRLKAFLLPHFLPLPYLHISWEVSEWLVQHTRWGREQNCIRLSDQIVCENKQGDVAAIEISFKSPCSNRTEPRLGNDAVDHVFQ
jgi:hypothetical protein